MSVPEVFRRIAAKLDEAGVSYMVTGSFASALYGSARSTQDIDIVIAATVEQLRSFIQILGHEYYAELEAALEACRRESLFNVIDGISGWKIDLIFRKSRSFSQEEFRRRQRVKFHGVELFVASAEDVIIAKLEWAKVGESERQIQDVAAILHIRGSLLDQSYIEKWILQLGLAEQWTAAKRAAAI
jgi:hypothetical protein